MSSRDSDIAIVGMSCVFPGASSLNAYWDNIIHKVSSFQKAPKNRIDEVFYDPDSKEPDRLYCDRGGFIDDYVEFDPLEYGIVPHVVKGTEPDHLLSLMLANRALKDASVFDQNISLENAGIIIGKGGFDGSEARKSIESIMGAESLVRLLKVTIPSLSVDELLSIKKKYQSQRGDFGRHNPMGVMSNMTAALVANRLNFGGPAYTVDAACASSLVAIDNCVKELQTNRSDLMLAGGINLAQNPSFWSVFSRLGAFSKSQMVRPFDKRADGVLPGEGGGFVVLRRLKDAIQDNHRIYGVLKGTGVSSDGANSSLMSPSWQGQTKALERAWSYSGLDCNQIGYLEAHGTATLLGDKTELQTLQKIFGHNEKLPRVAMGSVKSMIGHTMAAAGIAGFIKTTMAVYHGVLPPTLNCENPLDAFAPSRFRPLAEAADWSQTDLPVIGAVNAFGIGGTNAHVIVQQYKNEGTPKKSHHVPFVPSQEDAVLLLSRSSQEELIEAITSHDTHIGEGHFRLALFDPTEKRKALAIRVIHKNKPWRGRQDLWYTSTPLLTDQHKLAFIFPGLDPIGLSTIKTSNYPALAAYFGLDTTTAFDQEVPESLFYADLDESSRLLDSSLKQLTVVPDIVAGHSVGEWTACTTVDMVEKQTAYVLDERIKAKGIHILDAVFLTISCPFRDVEDLLKKEHEIYLANDNCTSQFVVCGKRKDINRFQATLNEKHILNTVLPFQTGYHTPFAERFVADAKYCAEHVAQYRAPKIPIWSSITASPYPSGIRELKQLHIDFLTQPVRFRELTLKLYQEGVRVFIQIGSGAIAGFLADTLKSKEVSIVSAAAVKRDALSQLKRVLAAVFIEGRGVHEAFLGLGQQARKNDAQIRKDSK